MYTTYTQGCFSFNFCPACQTTSIECSRNNIFSATYFVKVCLIRSRERRQNLTTFKNCAVELSCDHLDFLLKCYQSDHRSGFQFTCESSDELDTVLHHTGSWFCHGLKKYSTFLNVCALLPIHVNFLHLKFARVFTFTLCIELFLAYFVFTKLHEKQNITFLSVCFGLPFLCL